MSSRVSGMPPKRAISLVSSIAVTGFLAGCSSMGGFGGYGLPSIGGGLPAAGSMPLVTGSTAGQAAGNLNQAMPSSLPAPTPSKSVVPVRTMASGPYLPPANIGGAWGAATPAGAPTQPAGTVTSQPLPPLTSPGSNTAMSAQPSSQPAVKPVFVANTGNASSPSAAGSSPQLNVVPENAYVHRIQPGESLYSIARQYKVSTAELVGANKLVSADKIYVGQPLVIPGRAAAPLPTTTATTAATKTVASAAAAGAENAVSPAARPDRVQTASAQATRVEVPRASAPVAPSQPVQAETPAPQAAPVKTANLNTADVKTTKPAASGFIWPATGSVITDFASSKSGINIAAKEGASVRAVDAGTVIYVGDAVEGFGNLVLIKHDNGYVSAYAHLKSATVKKGDTVGRGQTIGAVGMTGSVSRPQLHFELRQGATPVDPVPMLAG